MDNSIWKNISEAKLTPGVIDLERIRELYEACNKEPGLVIYMDKKGEMCIGKDKCLKTKPIN